MKLKVHDDGKGKSQSFRVWCDVYPEIADGYGSTPEEARSSYLQNVQEYVSSLNSFSARIQDCEFVRVNYRGIPLGE
jgi:hypothetical protein